MTRQQRVGRRESCKLLNVLLASGGLSTTCVRAEKGHFEHMLK